MQGGELEAPKQMTERNLASTTQRECCTLTQLPGVFLIAKGLVSTTIMTEVLNINIQMLQECMLEDPRIKILKYSLSIMS